jgi:hypothetical protein
MILTELTPGETLILKQGPGAPIKDLLKYTMMDLLLKQVIGIEQVERQPSASDPVRAYKYISIGKNFRTYSSLQHEQVFLNPFSNDPDIKYFFKHFVKMAYENARTEKRYQTQVRSSRMLQDAFTITFLQKFLGGFEPTSYGMKLRAQVEDEIAHLEKTIGEEIRKDRASALNNVKQIGGNIFFIQGLDFELMKEIDEELMKEVTKSEPTTGGCGAGCYSTFDSYGHHFDSSCSSDPGSSGTDGGCGGGDGCGSGCGGD